jgi:hypothetical protein
MCAVGPSSVAAPQEGDRPRARAFHRYLVGRSGRPRRAMMPQRRLRLDDRLESSQQIYVRDPSREGLRVSYHRAWAGGGKEAGE